MRKYQFKPGDYQRGWKDGLEAAAAEIRKIFPGGPLAKRLAELQCQPPASEEDEIVIDYGGF